VKLCECGCGQEVTQTENRFIWGHNVCVNNPMKNLESVKKSSSTHFGIHLSEEHKKLIREAIHRPEVVEKIRIIQRDVHNRPEVLEKNRVVQREACNRLDVRMKQRELHIGENNPNWLGGISHQLYPFGFNRLCKKNILERDNHQCLVCGSVATCVHHIDYDKQNCSDENLASVCKKCNSRVNFNREYWVDFFKSILEGSYGRTKQRSENSVTSIRA